MLIEAEVCPFVDTVIRIQCTIGLRTSKILNASVNVQSKDLFLKKKTGRFCDFKVVVREPVIAAAGHKTYNYHTLLEFSHTYIREVRLK